MFKPLPVRPLISILTASLLAGCASTWNPTTPEDPYEKYNRAVFAFNLGVDRHVFRPVAKGYNYVTPYFVQDRVRNFFSNLNQVPVIINNLLQLNGAWFVSDTGRLLVNSTLGLAGLFDPATPLGMKKHNQDFGLTMAVWGVRESPYLIVPLLAPGTARDFLTYPMDNYLFSVTTYIRPRWIGYAAYGLDFVQLRAGLLSLDKAVDQAFDPYIFVRDFYLQNRRAKIQAVLHPDEQENVAEEELEPTPAPMETSRGTATRTNGAAGSQQNSSTPAPSSKTNS